MSSTSASLSDATLYYTPTSCGFASFTTALAVGLKLKTEVVDLATHKLASGADFYAINPKGNVPALKLADGTLLNENVAILLFLADQKLEAGLSAPAGSTERYVIINQLSYVATEIHKGVGGLFYANDSNRDFLLGVADKKLTGLDKFLADKQYLANGRLSVADLYLYIVLSWTAYLKVDLAKYPNAKKFFDNMAAQKIVQDGHAKAKENPASL